MLNLLADPALHGASWLLPLAQQASAQPSMGMFPIFMIAMAALLYIMILGPQSKERKRHEQALRSIKKGDQVITAGGLIGTVEAVDTAKDQVSVTIAPKVTVRISRVRIAEVRPKGKGTGADSKEAESDPDDATESAEESVKSESSDPSKKKGKGKK